MGACLALRSYSVIALELQEAAKAAKCDAESVLRVTLRCSAGRVSAGGRRVALMVLHAGHSVRHPAPPGRVWTCYRGRDTHG